MSFFLLVLYVIALYVRLDEQFPELAAYPIMFSLGVAASIAGLLSVMAGKRPTFRSPQLYLMVGLTGMIALSVALTGWLGGAVLAFDEFSTTAIVFFLIILNVNSFKRLRIIGAVLVLLTIFVAGQGIVAYQWGFQEEKFVKLTRADADPEGGLRPGQRRTEYGGVVMPRINSLGSLNDPNDLAQAILLAVPFLCLAWRRRRWVRNLVVVGVPLSFLLYGVYLTRSRGGILSLCVLVLLALRWRLGRTTSLALTCLLAVALIGLNFTGGRSLSDESAEARVGAWSEGLQMLRASPLWGVGYKGFIDLNNGMTAHNSFVLCFAELGLAGYFFWLALMVITILELHSLGKLLDQEPIDGDLRRWGRAIFLALCVFLAAGMFLSRTYLIHLYILVALGSALVDIARRNDRPVFELSPMRWITRVGALEFASIIMVYLFIRVSPV